MSRQAEIEDLVGQAGRGRVSDSAYDAGWLARLGAADPGLSEGALEWLRRHQLADGTWGAPHFKYHHDRAICTLSAITALALHGDQADRARIEAARSGLMHSLCQLDTDIAGETIGFEFLAPALLGQARQLRLVGPEVDDVLARLCAYRERKLAALPPAAVSNRMALSHSAELAGHQDMHLLDLDNMVAANGSVGFSPAATALYVTSVEKNEEALAYLARMTGEDGGVPNVGPIDVFEAAWTLWNLDLADSVPSGHDRLISLLHQAWTPGRGASFGAGFTPEDGDDTAMVYEVLARCGAPVDMDAVLTYAGPEHFYTWSTERNSSLSTNIHALGALRADEVPWDEPLVRRVTGYLADRQDPGGFWVDKWHASPYYPTAHAVLAGVESAGEMFRRAVDWLVASQRPDGSWGHFLATAEETAYCLQALVIARRCGENVPSEVVERGHRWLAGHADGPYPWLWIGKCLYSPDVVVRSAVLSALLLVEEDR
ncbi:prenyltransferase/squalene oxidase repeat-containing protein [Kutzneria sp. NPDC052558]|uniref:prenyltransferase/squalene oxidase repeat-containing protein n=1 Tax=Kutzneria sp. NPDC052558 TaxID=3364121 RepID=UPI0037CC3F80